MEKNVSELRKIFQNQENYFKIETKCFRIEKYFVTRIEKNLWN